MAIKEHDFVEIEYTGRFADGNTIFDTSDEALAKKNGIFSENVRYGPIVICIGEHQVIAGLDKNILGKEAGKDYTFSIPAEDGFGKKDMKLLRLIPTSAFRKQNINVMPGLQVEVDGSVGIIKNVTGGRIIVDFNHPFSGKDLIYEVKLRRLVEDKVEQLNSLIRLLLNMQPETVLLDGAATLTLDQKLPPEIEKELEKKLVELTGVKSVSFKAKEEKKEPSPEKASENKAGPEQK
jgi:FKBP-type peptidyl-prolyl cis-trans isomerase 2